MKPTMSLIFNKLIPMAKNQTKLTLHEGKTPSSPSPFNFHDELTLNEQLVELGGEDMLSKAASKVAQIRAATVA
jgi:hypothetical protein